MGGCQSSLTSTQRVVYERILSSIPVHYQEEIVRLSPKKFFDAYEYHLTALCHHQRKEYQMALLSECIAIQQVELLLPIHKDHVIFVPMHRVLSVGFWQLKKMDLAIKEGQIALNILLKRTPTDYIEIGLQYLRVGFFNLVGHQWKTAERCFMKAIITARLSDGLQGDFIQNMEEFLQMTRQNIPGSPFRIIPTEYQSVPGESREDLLRRALTDLDNISNDLGTFNIEDTELKRLPDQETESLVTADILNDVLNNLETFLRENIALNKLQIRGGGICFIAACFKSIQMKTSSISASIIEAALSKIINQMNNNADQYTQLKQLPFKISYHDDDDSNIAGVRMFQIIGKQNI
ncbi:hypothetical protein I4U23_015786 [Adineta vaga]|nr:hypothetical protein I4U23_015786 [Adineta vaga]